MKREFRIFMLTTTLLCGIALHYMFITIILNDNLLVKFWKETVIIILLLDTMSLRVVKKSKMGFYIDYSGIAFLFFIVSLLGASIIMTDTFIKSIFIVRLYIIPILVYYIAKNNSIFTKTVVSKIVKFSLAFYSIIALWGIFQALVLGDDFLINLGYPLKYAGRLRDSYYFGGFGDFQRVVSTFANTNVFGAVMGILIVVVVFNPTLVEKLRGKKYCLFILILAFVLTFSRSNWLSMILIICISNLKNRKLLKNILLLLLLFTFIILIYNQISGVNIFAMFQDYVMNTITMKDSSAAGRSGIWKEAFLAFINSPFGIGLGNVGMASANLSGEMKVVGESSYFAILLDTGIQGALSYFIALVCNFYATIKYKYNNNCANNYLKTVKYIIIYLMIMFLFSNHIYDLEIMIITFFFIGLGRNKEFLRSFS